MMDFIRREYHEVKSAGLCCNYIALCIAMIPPVALLVLLVLASLGVVE